MMAPMMAWPELIDGCIGRKLTILDADPQSLGELKIHSESSG